MKKNPGSALATTTGRALMAFAGALAFVSLMSPLPASAAHYLGHGTTPTKEQIDKFCKEYPKLIRSPSLGKDDLARYEAAFKKYCGGTPPPPPKAPAPPREDKKPDQPEEPESRIDRIITPNCLSDGAEIRVRGRELAQGKLRCDLQANGGRRTLKPFDRSPREYRYRLDRLMPGPDYVLRCEVEGDKDTVRLKACVQPGEIVPPTTEGEAPAVVDLVPEIQPGVLRPGQTQTLQVSILNRGRGQPQSKRYRVVLALVDRDVSRSRNFAAAVAPTSSRVLIQKRQWVLRIPGGGQGERVSMAMNIPAKVPDGAHWCAFADSDGGIAESNENNNLTCAPASSGQQTIRRDDLVFGGKRRGRNVIEPSPGLGVQQSDGQALETSALTGSMILRINGSAGPEVDVANGARVDVSWNSADFVAALGENLVGHWLVVEGGGLARSNPCDGATEGSLPDNAAIDGDGRHAASVFGTGLSGLTPGTAYFVRLCLRTETGGLTEYRHDSQQIVLNYSTQSRSFHVHGPDRERRTEPPEATGLSVTPDIAVHDIVRMETGQLVLAFVARGRDVFRSYYDSHRATLEAQGRPAGERYVYPFTYNVYVDNRKLPKRSLAVYSLFNYSRDSVASYLPRSGMQIVVTDGYWLPGDGRPHVVRVEIEWVGGPDADSSNNTLTRPFVTERHNEARFAVRVSADGAVFDIPFDSPYPDRVWTQRNHGKTRIIPSAGTDLGGYYYFTDATRGAVVAGSCVTARNIHVVVSGTTGRVPIQHIEIDLVGHPQNFRQDVVRNTRNHNPWRDIYQQTTFDLQSIIADDSRPITIRATVTDANGRRYDREISFDLMGKIFNDTPLVQLTMDRIVNIGSGEGPVTRDGGDIVLRQGDIGFVSGSITLNPNNCALDQVMPARLYVAINDATGPRATYGSIGWGAIIEEETRQNGNIITFAGDVNANCSAIPIPIGRYEISVVVRWNGLDGASGGISPTMGSQPPMTIDVRP